MKKILIISYFYHPELSPRSFRWTSLTRYLAKQNYKIDVVVPQKKSVVREEHNGINIFESKSKFFKFGNSSTTKNCQTKNKHNFKIKSILNSSISKIIWPDKLALWIPSAKNTIKKLNKNNYDCVISVGLPFVSHLLGYYAKKKNKIPKWIAEYGDPYTSNQGLKDTLGFRPLSFLDSLVERHILRKSDAVIFHVKNAKEKYKKSYPELSNKIKIIEQFFEPLNENSINKFNDEIVLDSKFINLVFAGTLYKELRSPEPLLKAVSKLNKIKDNKKIALHFIGDIREVTDIIERYSSEINITYHGMKPREYCVCFFKQADAVINILNTESIQVPSKVAECKYYSNHVITFNPLHSGIEHIDNSTTIEYKASTIVSSWQEVEDRLNSNSSVPKIIDPMYSIETVANKFIEIIQKGSNEI